MCFLQDGRLQPNDQLIEVNGHSLRGVSNRAAIEILKNSMVIEGNMRGMIEVRVFSLQALARFQNKIMYKLCVLYITLNFSDA